MAQRLALPVLAAIALASGCGGVNTTTKDGRVGDPLNSGGLRVTVLEGDRNVPRPDNDVTGLSTPRSGMKFVGIKARVCTDRDQAIKAYDFQLDRADGDAVRPRLPQRSYDDSFDVVRSGCEAGWIVFEIPSDDGAEAVTFNHDDTGSARPGDTERHARFTWKLEG